MAKFFDYSGFKNEKLTIISYSGFKEKGRSVFLISCDCGNQWEGSIKTIVNKTKSSCGKCKKPEIMHDDYFEVILESSKLGRKKAKFSIEDYEIISSMSHGIFMAEGKRTIYCKKKVNGKAKFIHRILMGCGEGEEVDHINGNGMDNRRENMRIVKSRENSINRSLMKRNKLGITGVRIVKRIKARSLFQAYIKHSGEEIFLGSYDNLFDAACARKSAEIKYGYHENHGRLKNEGE